MRWLALPLLLLGCGKPGLSLPVLEGGPAKVLPARGLASLFFFVDPECPVSNRYLPEMIRLREKFSPRGVDVRLVYPGRRPAEELRRHHAQFGFPGAALLDPELRLAKASQIRRTPEAAVYTPADGLIYHGRIDDRFADLGVLRPAPIRRDLEEVLDALLRGESPAPRGTEAVGCLLSEAAE